MLFIGEAKPQAPPYPGIPAWQSEKSWDELFQIAAEVSDMVAVHTSSPWGGSFDLLARAVDLTDKPILAKGIHETDAEIERALSIGANAVLVVNRPISPELIKMCLVEVNTVEELRQLPEDVGAVWNSRDLRTGRHKTETFDMARAAFAGQLCQASNITTLADIHSGADMVLVGRRLPEVADEMRQRSSFSL